MNSYDRMSFDSKTKNWIALKSDLVNEIKKSRCWQTVTVTNRYFWVRAAKKFFLDLVNFAGSFVGSIFQFNPKDDPVHTVTCFCVAVDDRAAKHCHTSQMWNGSLRS